MSFQVGTGILERMVKGGDRPAGDSEWPPGGERCYGLSGICYVWLKASNTIHLYDPVNMAAVAPEAPPPPRISLKPTMEWIGSPNFVAGRGGRLPRAVVIHTMAGSLAGSDSWFDNPASWVSAHFGVGLDGTIHQYVATQDTAWANGVLEAGNRWPSTTGVNPNQESLSIETEDRNDPTQIVTAEQYASVLALCKWLLSLYPGSLRWLVPHSAISPRSRPGCPGARWAPWLPDLAGDSGLALVL